MRYLILSDIHANVDALDAVLAAAEGSWDQALVLGDIVGYGGDPNGAVERVRALNIRAVIRGNHDKTSCGLEDGSNFNQVARTAAAWTFDALTPGNREYLRSLPGGPMIIDDWIQICHGSPVDEDEYIFDGDDAAQALEAAARPLCLFGHTHLPVVFQRQNSHVTACVPGGEEDHRVELREGVRYLVNPGSVGQPRDGDPRAAFGLYDPAGPTLILRRAAYPVDIAQRRILNAGLPASLANRLAIGR